MNKSQKLLVLSFCIGIILIPFGLVLNQISVPLTQDEIENILKDPKKTAWCKNTAIMECPLGPLPSKAPYEIIGQSMYFTGVASLMLGIVTLSKNHISINRKFLSHWIFFCGTIISVIILAIMPIRIPIDESQSFCIDPLCTPGLYHTQDPEIIFPILIGGIVTASAAVILNTIKLR